MIAIGTEELLSVVGAVAWLAERTGKAPHRNWFDHRSAGTLRRWMRHGICGIVLESCLIGRTRPTSAKALVRRARRPPGAAPAPSLPPVWRRRELDRVDAGLERISRSTTGDPLTREMNHHDQDN